MSALSQENGGFNRIQHSTKLAGKKAFCPEGSVAAILKSDNCLSGHFSQCGSV
jgi:hypothetical protein